MNALLLQLEFQTWKIARPWTYGASFAIADGLTANGVTCLTIPVVADAAPSSQQSWLSHARRFLAGQSFDQVWIWLAHTALDADTLQWITELAPMRVGFFMESLRYEEEDYRWAPELRTRHGAFHRQLEYLTHAVLVDERDVSELTGLGKKPALWCPGLVPQRFISSPPCPPKDHRVVFHGNIYGSRAHWIDHPLLRHRLTFANAPTQYTPNQQRFDEIQASAQSDLRRHFPLTETDMRRYVQALHSVREAEFHDWLTGLGNWSGIVNLPGLTRCFGGRVYEAMAVGRPVISWMIPDRPRINALFQDNREILLFPPDDPAALASRIDCLLANANLAQSIGLQGQRKLLAYHTAEHRMKQILQWLESGHEPDYGVQPTAAEQPTGLFVDPHRTGQGLPWHSPQPMQAPHEPSSQPPHEGSMDSDRFYVNLFVKQPYWSTPHPNPDEAARWAKIAAFLEYILRRVRHTAPDRTLRMLDVGCGRGWLTNLATMYGNCEGIEPVGGVIDHARRLFPHLRFEASSTQSVLERPDFAPYDVVLCSEVIEHVPHDQKQVFVEQLARLLKPDGYLILTTPRGEMWDQWKAIAPPNQPVEDWVTEEQLRRLFTAQGFQELGLERVHVEIPNLRFIPAPTPADMKSHALVPIYQVWACQRAEMSASPSFTRPPLVSVIVPTYNRPERLRDAIASVLAQTFRDFEIIVINDGTVDVDPVISALNVRGCITTIKHDRNRGLAAARNTGLRAAKGTYIAYLDDDDRYLPEHLDTLVTALRQSGRKAVYSDAWRVYERLEQGRYAEVGRDLPYSNEFNPAQLLISNYFPVLCVMHERRCIEDIGFFDESLFVHEDWDLWIRMATKFPFQHVKQTTAEFTWRTDGSSMTSSTRESFFRTTEIVYRKYRPYAERIPGVLAAQQQRMAELRAATVPQHFDCSIVIPVWNKMDLTIQCLTALAQLPEKVSYEVIVVDNGSSDGTDAFLKQLGGDARVITNRENLGFAKACNQGAQAARGKYVVFLNNDTIPQPGWLSAMVAEVNHHPEVGIVGSKLLFADGTIQHAGVVFDRQHLAPYHLYRGLAADHSAVNRRREFQVVTGACMLVRRELFQELGGFDEEYRNGFEDVDLCLKAREKGHAVVYQPRSVLYHLESQTAGRKLHDQANANRLFTRWAAHWWRADEDLYYHADGYKVVGTGAHDPQGHGLQLLADIQDRAMWAHVAAAQAAALKQDWAGVRRELRFVEHWPADADVLAWGATVCDRLKEPDLQQSFLSRYLEYSDAPDVRIALVRRLLEQRDLVASERHLRHVLHRYPAHGEGWLLQGILCMQREQYGEAETAFASGLRHGADRKKCLMGMGMAALGRAYAQGAWERFLQVLAEHPDDAEAIHWLLRAGTAQNRWDELSRQIRNYLSRNPADLSARFALASVLLRAEEIEEAQQEYDRLRLLSPSYDGLAALGHALASKDAALALEPSTP